MTPEGAARFGGPNWNGGAKRGDFQPGLCFTVALWAHNTAAGQHGLTVGLTWWILGMILAIGYFTLLFRMFKGKVRLEGEGY
jgi:hypothetical protein